VDEDVAPELVLGLADLRMLREERVPEDEEVVEVDEVQLLLARVVLAAGHDDLVADLVELRVAARHEAVERDAGVARVAGDVEEDVALRELGAVVVVAAARGEVVHELLRVLAVEDGEVRLVADELRVAAEDEVADVVERSSGDAALVAGDEGAHAGGRFARAVLFEGEQQDLVGRDAGLEQARDAVREGAGLAAAGAGDDEERAPAGHDHLELLLVEFLAV